MKPILFNILEQIKKGPKKSEVALYKPNDNAQLKKVLSNALGIKVIIDKKREIYFIGNIKFHLDKVVGLGQLVEIEAISEDEKNSSKQTLLTPV